MGATKARVTMGVVESYGRPRDDELSVMRAMATHASHCSDCADPYLAFQEQRGLCRKGYSYLKDIGDYFFCRNGRPYSVIDRDNFGSYYQVEVPTEYSVILSLFKALNEGFTGRAVQKPIVIQDSRRPKRREPEYTHTTPHTTSSRRSEDRERYYREKRRRAEEKPSQRRQNQYSDPEIIVNDSRRQRR